MTETQIEKGNVSFQTEGRLLQELGERLVAKPEVALVELIKNSYDADASFCEVSSLGREKTIVIRDDGSWHVIRPIQSAVDAHCNCE